MHVRIELSRRAGTLAALAHIFLTGSARAQDPASVADAGVRPEIVVTGFVDAYYGYSFNRVDPVLRSFDIRHDAFSLALAEVAIARSVSPVSRVGFRMDLDFGETAGLVAAYEPAEDGKEEYRHLQQAYLSVLAGDKLQLDLGKFVTPLGAELIESQDNWNYSRSVLFGYAIPFYHTGLRASLPVNDRVLLNGYLANGWNNSSEVNENKTWALGATLKPGSGVTWVGTVMSGRESADSGEDRTLFDTTLALSLGSRLTVMANYDYGQEGDVIWSGFAAYVRYQVRPDWLLAARFEVLDDEKGGFMTIGQKARTFALTSDHLVADGLRARLEYRGDFTQDPFFVDHTGQVKDSQSSLLAGFVYAFGGNL